MCWAAARSPQKINSKSIQSSHSEVVFHRNACCHPNSMELWQQCFFIVSEVFKWLLSVTCRPCCEQFLYFCIVERKRHVANCWKVTLLLNLFYFSAPITSSIVGVDRRLIQTLTKSHWIYLDKEISLQVSGSFSPSEVENTLEGQWFEPQYQLGIIVFHRKKTYGLVMLFFPQ